MTMTNTSVLILLMGAAIIAFYYFWTFNHWKKKGINALPPNLLFGNLSNVILRKIPVYRMFKEVYATCKNRGDKFIGFYFLNQPALLIVDPELIKNILVKDFNNFTDRSFYLNKDDPFTVNIVSAKGSQWKEMREQLSPAFSPSKLKHMCHTLLQVGHQLKVVLDKSAENSEVVNLQDVTSKFIIDAIGVNIFGIECKTLENLNIEFRNVAAKIAGGSFIQNIKFMLSMLCPSILSLFKIPLVNYDIQEFYFNLVRKTVEYRENNKIVRNDLLQLLIQLRNNINIEKENNLTLSNLSEKEKSLKIEEITAQAVIFLGAAYESTAATISLCIYELATNEDIQNNLRNEVASVCGDHKKHISYDDILKMTYLDQCVLETLRKYALITNLGRICTEEYKLPNSDVVLDVGTTLYIPIYEIHHDPEYYPNPDKFDPERFSHENKLKRPNYTFLSLGEGHRNCIGARLGLLKIKIFLVIFLTNYNFSINSRTKVPPTLSKNNFIVCFENPLYLNIKKI